MKVSLSHESCHYPPVGSLHIIFINVRVKQVKIVI